MTQEFINRLFAAVMGKCEHRWYYYATTGNYECAKCGQISRVCRLPADPYCWSPSSDSEAKKEVRDWFTKQMPGWWAKYIREIWGTQTGDEIYKLNKMLSITNLAQYIVDNPEMFYEECPECQDGHVPVGEYQHYGLVSREMAMDAGNIDLMGSLTPCGTEIEWGQCQRCNGTGKIVKPQFAEAVRVIEQMKEGKE